MKRKVPLSKEPETDRFEGPKQQIDLSDHSEAVSSQLEAFVPKPLILNNLPEPVEQARDDLLGDLDG